MNSKNNPLNFSTEVKYVALLIEGTKGGGIKTRLFKWARELHRREIFVEIWVFRDISSPYYNQKISQDQIEEVDLIDFTYDSLDKKSYITKKLVSQVNNLGNKNVVDNLNAIISFACPPASNIVNGLKQQGWQGCFLVSVPSEDGITISSALRALTYVDIFLPVSSQINTILKENLSRIGAPNIPSAICFGGIEPNQFKEGFRENNFTPLKICYLGRLDPIHKRIWDLLEIAKEVSSNGIACNWSIVGSSNIKEKFEKEFISELPNVNVNFYGNIPHDQVSNFFRTQHIFVLPSAYEGFSNALCEAMEAGCVPLVTNVSGSNDAITNGLDGYIYEIGDIHGFAQGIITIALDQPKWLAMSQYARIKAITTLTTAFSIDTLLQSVREFMSANISSNVFEHINYIKRNNYFSLFLESILTPNFFTRTVRKFWRKLRGKPIDAGKRF